MNDEGNWLFWKYPFYKYYAADIFMRLRAYISKTSLIWLYTI